MEEQQQQQQPIQRTNVRQRRRAPSTSGFTLDDFVPIRLLGRGSVGTVLLAAHKQQRQHREPRLYAIKAVRKDEALRRRKSSGAGFQTELEILTLVAGRHPFLPCLHAHFESDIHAFLVMDYCGGGDLNVLRQRQPEKRFSESAIRFYAAELVLALESLHEVGVVYRDLKPENVLISSSGHVVLTDFDLALRVAPRRQGSVRRSGSTGRSILMPKKTASSGLNLGSCFAVSVAPEDAVDGMQPPEKKGGGFRLRMLPRRVRPATASSKPVPKTTAEAAAAGKPAAVSSDRVVFVGTEEYVAPEVIKGEGYGYAVDWWGLGVMLYELLFGVTPFHGADRKATFARILHADPPNLIKPRPSANSSGGLAAARASSAAPLHDLIARLLAKDPAQRLTSSARVKNHPFFQGVQWPELHHIARPPVLPSAMSAAAAVSHVRDQGATIQSFLASR